MLHDIAYYIQIFAVLALAKQKKKKSIVISCCRPQLQGIVAPQCTLWVFVIKVCSNNPLFWVLCHFTGLLDWFEVDTSA
jgi:hypothetical protein